MVKEKTKHK